MCLGQSSKRPDLSAFFQVSHPVLRISYSCAFLLMYTRAQVLEPEGSHSANIQAGINHFRLDAGPGGLTI